ncbi:MAG: hypothetical protein KC478_17260, partial [Bacteriovoracaceae bacterium]|nr:hypothetical protein [Bacteriovoracaceae bacterium]
ASLAKQRPTAITSTTVLDGSGAVVKMGPNEFAYDLRLPSDKGLLPLNHPVRLAQELKMTHLAEDGFDIQSHPLVEQLLKSNSKKSAAIIKRPFKAGEVLIFADWYRCPKDLFYNSDNDIALLLDDERALLLSNKIDLSTLTPVEDTFEFLPFFDFFFHIAFNQGLGRVASIEQQAKSFCSKDWNVQGLHISLPFNGNIKQIHKQGLLINDHNVCGHLLELCLPISIYDYQIKDIIERLLLTEEN